MTFARASRAASASVAIARWSCVGSETSLLKVSKCCEMKINERESTKKEAL